jgi:predicted nucleic acid-binding protein
VIPETAWQIERNLGPRSEADFLRLITTGELGVADLSVDDYQRCIDLIEIYQDLRLGLVDASVITIAENRRVTTIATLNERDFRVVRPRHVKAFELIP